MMRLAVIRGLCALACAIAFPYVLSFIPNPSIIKIIEGLFISIFLLHSF